MPNRKPRLPAVEVVSMGKPSKPSPKARRAVHKVCSECGREQPITNFYTNKNFMTQMNRDRWCKSCIKEKCVDEKSFRYYLYQNNRSWKPELWAEAVKTAMQDLNLMVEFTQMTDAEAQQREIDKRAVACACAVMNKPQFYKYVDNESRNFEIDIEQHVEAEKVQERDSKDPYYNVQIYSAKWNGAYTQFEIDTMDDYLEKIVQARGVEDEIALDYAKKFVAQSALVNRLHSVARTCPTKENIAAYKEATATLEVISKAANIAPAYKKADTTVGLGSLGVFIKLMENGQRMGEVPVFPPDQIDGIRKDFRHTVAAVEGAGGLWT